MVWLKDMKTEVVAPSTEVRFRGKVKYVDIFLVRMATCKEKVCGH